MIPYASDAIGNVLRLKNLKHVGNRRIGGPDILEELNVEEPEVKGTRAPPFLPNTPIPDMQQGGIVPESYDVRANEIINPAEEEKENNVFQKIGAALGNQTLSRAAPMEEEIPVKPENPLHKLGRFLAPHLKPPPIEEVNPEKPENPLYKLGRVLEEKYPPSPEQVIGEAKQAEAQAGIPAPVANEINANAERIALNQAEIDAAMKEPMEHAVYGATDFVSNMPELQEKASEIIGQNFDAEIAAQTANYEKVLTDLNSLLETEQKGFTDAYNKLQLDMSQYDEQAAGIKQRIETNQATDQDKWYIGLALLMPVLIGSLMGKEAGVGALAGTAKGFGDILANREKNVRADEELLSDLNKARTSAEAKGKELALEGRKLNITSALKQGEVEMEKAKIPAKVREQALKEQGHLLGREKVKWVNPKTGKEEEGVQILPGIVAKKAYAGSEEAIKARDKAAVDVADKKAFTVQMNSVVNNIMNASQQLKDQDIFEKGLNITLGNLAPGALAKLTQQIDVDGRNVTAGPYLEEQYGLLMNIYAKANQLGQIDKPLATHFERLFLNPVKSLVTGKQAIDQMIDFKNFSNESLYRYADSHGFVPEFLLKDIAENEKGFYKNLNRKEAYKEAGVQEKNIRKAAYAK